MKIIVSIRTCRIMEGYKLYKAFDTFEDAWEGAKEAVDAFIDDTAKVEIKFEKQER